MDYSFINTVMLLADDVGKCRLTKVTGGEAMRTTEILGVALMLPVKGAQFYMRAPPLDREVAEEAKAKNQPCGRIFNTSKITEIVQSEGRYELTTSSGSKYVLEMLD
jgi:hypothetical protein